MAAKKIILITGANTGIGLESIKALLQSETPYHILLGSRSLEKGEAAMRELQAEFPSTPSSLELLGVDVSSDESIEAAFKAVKEKHGRVDTLVNNAGTCSRLPVRTCHLPSPR
jgi:NAD(P)-dependent dehydrogenase (short-subunit alcohol dehydrogenase family)